jgi:c-di-GMP-binding flagellar brake protein YcgR
MSEPTNPLNPGPHRKYPRIGVNFAVEYAVGGQAIRRRATTLGGGGLFLTGEGPDTPGMEVSLRFRPAKHLPPMLAKGIVRYLIPGKGAAVEFTEIAPEDRQVLLRLIHRRTGERRRSPRVPLVTQVEGQGLMSLAYSRDVSVGGMFLEGTELPPPGSRLVLRFNLDESGAAVITEAKVMYTVAKMGMGVQFIDLSRENRERIETYIAKMPALPVKEPLEVQYPT